MNIKPVNHVLPVDDTTVEWVKSRRLKNGRIFGEVYPFTQVPHNPVVGPLHVFKVFLDKQRHRHVFVTDPAHVVETYKPNSLYTQVTNVETNFGISCRLYFEVNKSYTIYYNFFVARNIGTKGQNIKLGPVSGRVLKSFQQNLLRLRFKSIRDGSPSSSNTNVGRNRELDP